METDDQFETIDAASQTTHESYETLVESEKVEKSVALAILKLQHAVETSHLQEMHMKQREVDALRHQIKIMELEKSYTEAFEALRVDVETLKSDLCTLEEKQTKSDEMIVQIIGTMHDRRKK